MDVKEKMWQCLTECFCTLGYYFSVDELLLFCVLADASVAIFLVSDDSLQYHASRIGSDNGDSHDSDLEMEYQSYCTGASVKRVRHDIE